MKERILRVACIASAAFFVVAMGAIVALSMNKSIEIENVAQDEVAVAKPRQDEVTVHADNSLEFEIDQNTDCLCIPLPEGTNPEQISIENHYMDLELRVILKDTEAEYYELHPIRGRRSEIIGGQYKKLDDDTVLCFGMKGLYEYKTVFENDELYISFFSPRELYEQVVVIDPACGGKDDGRRDNGLLEKNVALAVAKALKKKLDASDIKAYYTRMDDVNPTAASRVSLANATRADMYIRIEADSSRNDKEYGVSCYYNDEFFIPRFGNVELADILETEVVTAVKGKALGLKANGAKDYHLKYATVPSAAIRVGFMSNGQEATLLGRQDYIDRLADGIYNAIIRVYEEQEKGDK